jgi:transcriptional regulator with XRE-family HTH domain
MKTDNIFPTIDKSQIIEFHKSVGKNVKQAREDKGVSQLELAILIGHKSPSFISNCENNKNEHFNLEHLFLIANVLEVDMANLILFKK